MSASKQTATTAYGEVEYETVTCDSCETEVMKREADRFLIGEYHGVDKWSHKPYDEYKLSDVAMGWCCPYCRDEETIIGTPTSNSVAGYWNRLSNDAKMALVIISAWALAILWVVL